LNPPPRYKKSNPVFLTEQSAKSEFFCHRPTSFMFRQLPGRVDFNRNADLGNGRVAYRRRRKLPLALRQFLQFPQPTELWEKVYPQLRPSTGSWKSSPAYTRRFVAKLTLMQPSPMAEILQIAFFKFVLLQN